MARFQIAVFFCVLILSCKEPVKQTLSEGMWLTELKVSDTEVLPFNFKLHKAEDDTYRMEIYNAEEVIKVDEIQVNNDSISIKAPVFEGYLAGTFTPNKIVGNFIKKSLDRVVPFTAYFGEENRFRSQSTPKANVSGVWKTEFSPQTTDSYMGKGIFEQQGDQVTGTFRTTTGDYRYLEGKVMGDSLKLSAFDGAHAFLFTAKITDSTMQGTFYSGNHFTEPFIASRNEAYELPDADTLTYLKEGYDALAFSFPNEDGQLVSLLDERFRNKVVLVQIMGTWCPNCLDETKFYVDYLEKNKNKDLEVVALAFEYAKTKEGAFKSIQRLKERIGVPYPILLAQYGSSDKQKAQEKLPMLNHVLSYPTSIFIDKKGVVRKIHTGFNGPATGEKHEAFKREFNTFIQQLTSE